jgi:hypothetical protein
MTATKIQLGFELIALVGTRDLRTHRKRLEKKKTPGINPSEKGRKKKERKEKKNVTDRQPTRKGPEKEKKKKKKPR